MYCEVAMIYMYINVSMLVSAAPSNVSSTLTYLIAPGNGHGKLESIKLTWIPVSPVVCLAHNVIHMWLSYRNRTILASLLSLRYLFLRGPVTEIYPN